MAKGLFPAFVRFVAAHWRRRFPWIAPVDRTLCPALPKARTFYAGCANRYERHLFINLKHSSKPWSVGEVTVNVVVSPTNGMPQRWLGGLDLEEPPEGSYRLGMIAHQVDKWWCLLPPSHATLAGGFMPRATGPARRWVAKSYAEQESVFAEASEDISRDLDVLFERVGQRVSRLTGA